MKIRRISNQDMFMLQGRLQGRPPTYRQVELALDKKAILVIEWKTAKILSLLTSKDFIFAAVDKALASREAEVNTESEEPLS